MSIGESSTVPIEALYRRAGISPNGPAFIVGEDRCNYAQLAARVECLARGLAGRGIQKGDRISLHMPNRPEFVITAYACFHIGAVVVLLNSRLEAVELKLILERLRPALYIGDADLYGKLNAVDRSILPLENRCVAGNVKVAEGVRPWTSLLIEGSALLPIEADSDSSALMLVSSGTEGVSWGIHTHARLAALFGLPFICSS
jgi:acyl-CoA synthetase (AMP-forming)/AMP-acid ligase II